MANLKSIDTCTNSIESVIADETLVDLILNAMLSIRNNKKRLDSISIFEHISREVRNPDITHTLVETRLSLLTVDGKLEIKYLFEKASYWIRAESQQDLSSSKTVGNSSSTATPVVSPLNCKTLIISSNESNVNNNLSLEEIANC